MSKNHYYIIVRDYACIFSKSIADIIHAQEPESVFHFITMHAYVQDYFEEIAESYIQVHYMPKLLEKCPSNIGNTKKLDKFLFNKYNSGINLLYDIERFKPQERPEEFISRHVDVLFSIIQEPGIVLSLTMDHFVFILTGMVNDYRGGNNIYIQPTGFPLNAYILMNNPWQPIPVYLYEQNAKLLPEYEQTLALHPKDSVWYMKVDEFSSQLIDRARNKMERIKETRKLNKLRQKFTSYSYLDYLYIIDRKLHLSQETGEHVPTRETTLLELKEKYFGKVKVFFYPLHLEPEMSILAYSPFFQNQLELIKLIAKSLKFGDILIIKENPKSLYRGNAFYKVVDSLPNVFWIGKETNSREIIRFSNKLIGISGTAGIESALLGVPTMGIGFPPFYKLLAQKPFSFCPLNDIRSALYSEFSPSKIAEAFLDNWPEYSKSIVQLNLRPTAVNSILRSGEIPNPKQKLRRS